MANSPPAFALFWPLACTSRKSISTATCGLKTDFVGRFCATKSPQCEDARKFGYRREMPVFIVAKKAADPGSAPMYVDDFNSSGVGEMSRLGAEGAVGGSFLKMPSSDPAESLEWFYRDTEAVPGFNELPVLLLHGLPSQSYSFREVTPALKDAGFRSVAPDLIGWGFSNAPQAGYGFDYDPEEYLKTLTKFIDEIGLDRFHLCVQGFLGGPLGMELALSAPDRIEKLIILNSPLTAESAELPGAMGRMRFPILGEAISQDVISVERTLEKGGIYALPNNAAEVYRRPYQRSANYGFAMLATIRKMRLKPRVEALVQKFRSWDKPTALIFGSNDKYIKAAATCDKFKSTCPGVKEVKLIDQCGHYPQEDYSQLVNESLTAFLLS